jgi:hypothetical protein
MNTWLESKPNQVIEVIRMERVKSIVVAACLVMIIILAACQSVTPAPVPIENPSPTTMPALTSTLLPSITPSPTATWWMTPEITATPLNATIHTNKEMVSVIKSLHPDECIGPNDLKLTSGDVPVPSPVKLIEVDQLPDPNIYYVEEIAVNIDSSRQAVVACMPDKCVDNVYVKDNKTDKVYEIDWGRMPWRPIQRLIWINEDILMFGQSSNPHYGAIIAINFAKKEYQYFGMASDGCSQSTPTP